MNSFVKPGARAKFGLAIASSTVLAASPLGALPASAATITVDTCVQYGSDGQVGLGDAITTANNSAGADVIDLTSLSSCTISISSSMEIAESLTINGGDRVTLQLIARAHIFTMASGVGIDLAVNDLVMDGLDDEWFAGFNLTPTVASTVTLTGVTMRDFDLTALYSRNGYTTLTVVDSVFENNRAPGGAGAIRSSGPVTVVNSTFNGNISTNGTGGAIRVDGSSLTITGSTFTSNNANRGGAIGVMYAGSTLTITDDVPSTFSDNSSDFWGGGAIYVYDSAVLFEGVTDVTHNFIGNQSNGTGGAIGIGGYQTSTLATFDANLYFSENVARDGGALSVVTFYEGESTIAFNGDVSAVSNSANEDGGAFYLYVNDFNDNLSRPSLDVTFSGNSTNFTGNTATADKGGAIYFRAVKSDSTLDFDSAVTTFASNSAATGGALALWGSNTSDDTTYSNYVAASQGVIDMTLNRATNGRGGAIYNRGFEVSLFGGGPNYAGSWPSDPDYYVTKNTFVDNTATLGGGFGYVNNGGGFDIQLGYFSGNESIGGSVIESHNGHVSFTANDLRFNTANSDGSGGAISMWYSEFESAATLFYQNTGFATVFGYYSDLHLLSNNFVNNQSLMSTVLADMAADYGVIAHHNTFVENTSTDEYMSRYSAIADWTTDNLYSDVKTIGANIFYSSDPLQQHVQITNVGKLGHGNLFTGEAAPYLTGLLVPFDADLGDTYSMLVTGEQLDLLGLDNFANPSNPGINLTTVGIGPDSVAIDLLRQTPIQPLGDFPFDSRFEQRVNFETIEPLHGGGFDAGAFEYVGARGGDDQPPAVEPNVLITAISKAEISAGGDAFKVFGRGLDGVSALYVGDVRVGFDVVSSGELTVTTGSLPTGRFAINAVADDGRAVYQDGIVVIAGTDLNLEPKFWTKLLSDGTAKIYAKNVVGAGKVQFFVNGKEVAWVRAVDGNDPKLRQANGVSYLVRTVELAQSGKTRLEVKLNGKRVRFTTYVR